MFVFKKKTFGFFALLLLSLSVLAVPAMAHHGGGGGNGGGTNEIPPDCPYWPFCPYE